MSVVIVPSVPNVVSGLPLVLTRSRPKTAVSRKWDPPTTAWPFGWTAIPLAPSSPVVPV